MDPENSVTEYKSVQKIRTGDKGFNDLAKTCVCLAKKGTEYMINPKLIANARINIKPSLVTIEAHRLRALIEEDLTIHPESTMVEVQKHLVDVPLEEIRKCVYKMVKGSILEHTSSKTYRKYWLSKKNRN
jgi:ATP-dependent DNA helicase RecG